MIWTPRQRRYLNILKRRRMTNLSRPVKFPPDTLVKRARPMPTRFIYVVDHNSGGDICHINHRDFPGPVPAHESDLRALYWYEFAFHRDPMKGHLMIGKNRALPLLYGFAVLLAGTIASLKSVEGAWKWACPAILAMFLVGTIIGTVRNAKGKQF
jgi:hypothetical protein